jgi:hypothetical protein
LHGKGRYTKKKLDVPQVTDARWAQQHQQYEWTAAVVVQRSSAHTVKQGLVEL